MGKSNGSYRVCRGCGRAIYHGQIELEGKAYCRRCGLNKLAENKKEAVA